MKTRMDVNDTAHLDPATRSDIADELSELKRTILRFSQERDRLPQPLFWSLFHSRIAEIKKIKNRCRELEELLGD